MAAEQITQAITEFPPPPQSGVDNEVVFNQKSDAFVAHQATNYTPEVNEWADQANAVSSQVNANAISADENATATAEDRAFIEPLADAIRNMSGKNILVNGDMVINQRVFNGSSWVDGEYAYDRWKATATAMVQIVEEGNFELSTEYTLSGEGVTTQQITSPASGNWTIPEVPRTARKIQLEKGSVATEFEYKQIGTELALCQRYYELVDRLYCGLISGNSTSMYEGTSRLLVEKRDVPTIGHYTSAGTLEMLSGYTAYIYGRITPAVAGYGGYISGIFVDAEL